MSQTPARMSQRRLVRDKEAAEYVGISRRHLWSLSAAGRFPRVKISSRCTLFDLDDLDRFIEARKVCG